MTFYCHSWRTITLESESRPTWLSLLMARSKVLECWGSLFHPFCKDEDGVAFDFVWKPVPPYHIPERYLVFVPSSWHRAPKTCGNSWVIKVIGRPLDSLRMEAGCQEDHALIRSLELSVPLPNLWGWVKSWRLRWSPMANNLTNHIYVMKPP